MFKYWERPELPPGIIGGKAFVLDTYRKVKEIFQSKRDKVPKSISGLTGIYSLKRLTE
ncbi:MAG: hypothetical protein RBT11_08785 [Desulfobacterales bacterium]|jgi:hypothetical protein|nr:hypothetical protein [Desulfobacterales bacterium]